MNQMPLLVNLAYAKLTTPSSKTDPKHMSGRRSTRKSGRGFMVLPVLLKVSGLRKLVEALVPCDGGQSSNSAAEEFPSLQRRTTLAHGLPSLRQRT